MKKNLIFIFFLVSAASVYGQTFLTAENYFAEVSEQYAGFKDYEADITITIGKNEVMIGRASYKSPTLLRLDFSQPAEQVFIYNGEMLTIYLPRRDTVLSQVVDTTNTSSSPSLATAQGLSLLRRSYQISYETGPEAVSYGNTEEKVIRLVLTRRGASEGFRKLILSISEDTKLIRSIEGTTIGNENMKFEFSNYSINKGIPDTRFLYDSPPSANTFNNFLFNE